MAFSNLWNGRTARLPYLVVLVISFAAIAVLPFITGKIATAYAGGMDPALAILRMLLRTSLLAIGVLIAGGPLVFFARRRMRELGLSGVWLLVFPIGPLQVLFDYAIASASLVIWPLPVTSPIVALPFWVEVAFGISLAVLPSGDYLEHSDKPALRFAHLATTCEGRLGHRPFAHHLVVTGGLTIALQVVSTLGWMSNVARPGAHSVWILAGLVASLASVAASASAVLTIFVMMFVTASTIRRLHDLNQRGWWIVLFPLGVTSLLSFVAMAFLSLGQLQLLTSMLFDPYSMFSSVQSLGCLILLAWLLLKRGSDLDNPYGPPVNPPDDGYLPAFGR